MNVEELGSGDERMIRAKLRHEYKLLSAANEKNDEDAIFKHQKNIKHYKDLLGE